MTETRIHKYYFGNTLQDLVWQREGFGLTATSDSTVDLRPLVSGLEPYLRTDTAPGDRLGVIGSALSAGRMYLFWKVGGLRDHRGRPGGRAAQVIGPLDGSRLHPAWLPRLLGSQVITADASVLGSLSAAGLSLADFAQELAAPSAELAARNLPAEIVAECLLRLNAGGENLRVMTRGLSGLQAWEGLWATLPPSVQQKLTVTTEFEHAEFASGPFRLCLDDSENFPLHQPEVDSKEILALTPVLRGALLSYVSGDVEDVARWMSDGYNASDLRGFLDWIRSVRVIQGVAVPSIDVLVRLAEEHPQELHPDHWAEVVSRLTPDAEGLALMSTVVAERPELRETTLQAIMARAVVEPLETALWLLLAHQGGVHVVAETLKSCQAPQRVTSLMQVHKVAPDIFGSVLRSVADVLTSVNLVDVYQALPEGDTASRDVACSVLAARCSSDLDSALSVLSLMGEPTRATESLISDLNAAVDANALALAWRQRPNARLLPWRGPVLNRLVSDGDSTVHEYVVTHRLIPIARQALRYAGVEDSELHLEVGRGAPAAVVETSIKGTGSTAHARRNVRVPLQKTAIVPWAILCLLLLGLLAWHLAS